MKEKQQRGKRKERREKERRERGREKETLRKPSFISVSVIIFAFPLTITDAWCHVGTLLPG
jgi:hypothetical protein